MLRRLYIRNFLLIDEAELPLEPGFTVITGETGSGKSILLGALSLAMGERAETGVLHDPAQRCVIELEMDATHLRVWFDRHELPFDKTTIVRRQLEPGGRSRAFINDTPVRLDQLRDLTARSIHIHGQHHTLLLNDPGFHLGAIDRVAGHQAKVKTYGEQFKEWKRLRTGLEQLRQDEARSRQELEFMVFQHDELVAAHLQPDEQQDLEQRLRSAEHAGELKQVLTAVDQGLQADDGLLMGVARITHELTRAARYDERVQALLERLQPIHIELKDIAGEAVELAGSMEQDPQGTERLRDRLDLLIRLQQKHRVRSLEELIALQAELEARIQHTSGMGDRIAELAKADERALRELHLRAKELSILRHEHAGRLAGEVERLLHDLGMPDAVFQLRLHDAREPGPNGGDTVQALFTANRDRAPGPLDKIASGGELSRVMLALISLSADATGPGTLILDEVDTGVSGAVAERVGALMRRMGRDRQVIAITHLPQIAGQAAHHLEVSKRSKGERVITRIGALQEEERITAIARMLSGRRVSKVALDNARALMGRK